MKKNQEELIKKVVTKVVNELNEEYAKEVSKLNGRIKELEAKLNIDITNNTSERGLRQVKRKLALPFSFKNINRMKDYSIILSYLETCYRNILSRFAAL